MPPAAGQMSRAGQRTASTTRARRPRPIAASNRPTGRSVVIAVVSWDRPQADHRPPVTVFLGDRRVDVRCRAEKRRAAPGGARRSSPAGQFASICQRMPSIRRRRSNRSGSPALSPEAVEHRIVGPVLTELLLRYPTSDAAALHRLFTAALHLGESEPERSGEHLISRG